MAVNRTMCHRHLRICTVSWILLDRVSFAIGPLTLTWLSITNTYYFFNIIIISYLIHNITINHMTDPFAFTNNQILSKKSTFSNYTTTIYSLFKYMVHTGLHMYIYFQSKLVVFSWEYNLKWLSEHSRN